MNTRKYVDGRLADGELPPADKRIKQPPALNYNELRAQFDGDDPLPPARVERRIPVAEKVKDGALSIKNTNDMRKFLLTQLVAAAEGKIGKDVVDNICKISQQVYQATKLELEAEKLLKDDKSATIRALDLVIDDDADS